MSLQTDNPLKKLSSSVPKTSLALLICSMFAGFTLHAAESTPSSSIEKTLKANKLDWNLIDYRSKPYSSNDLKGKVHVVAFLGTECPLAKLYSIRLESLQSEFATKGVSFIAVDSNQQDSLAEIAAFARRQSVTYPILKDPDGKVARMYGATRTPEVFLIDDTGSIRYSGRIDDQYVIGNVRQSPEKTELRDAIQFLLEKRDIAVTKTPAMGCLIGQRPDAVSTNTITYTKHIAPIMQSRCVDCHHAGDIGPMQLDNYDDVSAWSDMIMEVVNDKRMPPWHADPSVGHFANDRSMPKSEIDLLKQWVDGGCQQGDPADLPASKTYTVGWQLPREPDLVLDITPTPFSVQAVGEVKYQHFVVDPKFTEDKWISAAEIQPGNRAVVHHILAFARDPEQKQQISAERSYLTGYVPGTRYKPYPKGSAKFVKAGSVLVFQVHYTPIGTEQTDQSRIGFIFADDKDIQREIQTTSVVQPRLAIPPHEANYTVDAYLPETLPDCELVCMSPHMHLRGKSFSYELVSSDGKKTPLLNVPKYDFNWQTAYELSEPVKITEGSLLYCKATFDNSTDNLYNPDPNQKVRWGDQTDDEMMIGYFDISVPKEKGSKNSSIEQISPENGRLFTRWDVDGNEALSKEELPDKYRVFFDLADSDKNGSLNVRELDKAAKQINQLRRKQ